MEFEQWIRQQMADQVLIRMQLRRVARFGPGAEAVTANLVTLDDQVGVMLLVEFSSVGGEDIGELSLRGTLAPDSFTLPLRAMGDDWSRYQYWDQQCPAVCTYRPARREEQPLRSPWSLPTNNMLVLQHLMRILGQLETEARALALRSDTTRLHQALMLMINRLRTVVIQGDKSQQELGLPIG